MNMLQKVSIGLASIVALAVFGLPLHGMHDSDNKTVALVSTVQPYASAETPQSLQWDMEYGDRTPPSSAR